MIAVPRLTRIAGLFAVGLAAFVATAGQAIAGPCSTLQISPSSGLSAGGDTVTLTVTHDATHTDDLSNTNSVMFGANQGTVTSASQTSVTVTTPAKSAPVITSAFRTNFLFGGTSAYGSTSGGDNMTVQGQNFSPSVNITIKGSANCDGTYSGFSYSDGSVNSVNVGGDPGTNVSVLSDNLITLITPPGVLGVTSVSILTVANQVSTGGTNIFAYVGGGVTVNGINPPSGLTTDAVPVQISGQNFVPGTFGPNAVGGFANQPATSVNFPCTGGFNTQASTPVVKNSGEVDLTSPTCSGTTGSVVNVTVTTPTGTSAGQYQWVIAAKPVISSISPDTADIRGDLPAGSTQITISGVNFTGLQYVTFGAVQVTGFQLSGAGTITLQPPAQTSAGPVNVTVTVLANSSTGATSTSDNFSFTYTWPAPIISSVQSASGAPPASGSTAGGTAITISGQYFNTNAPNAATTLPTVTVGGVPATNVSVTNDGTTIQATTGAHSPGTVDVVVTTTSGSTTGKQLFTYGTPAPTVTSVSPATGGINGGDSVTVSGTYFAVSATNTTVSSVTFGGQPLTNLSVPSCDANNNCTITGTTPAHAAGPVNVVVTTTIGSGTGQSLFTYSSSPPTVTAITPSSGSTLGGTQVKITGTGFSGTPLVKIGNVLASQVTFNGCVAQTAPNPPICTITAVTPAGAAATNVPVVVTTSFGDSAAATIWTYQTPVTPPQAAPTLTSVSPSSGTSLGKTLVTLTGTNLTGATSVTFGGAPGSSVTVVSATQITVLTPPLPAGAVVGTPVDIVVTTPATTTTTQTATLPASYTYNTGAPTVTSVLANTGTTLGGNVVTISGTNLSGATAVNFGTTPVAAGKFTILSATTIIATTPAQAAGTVDVTVTTPVGTSATGTSDQYTYTSAPLPTITSISPASGDTAGNTQVTINGTNFVSGGSVTIGGNPTTLFTFVSSTQIKVTTAAHNPGVVDVVVTMPAGSVTGTGLYTYVAGAPTVTGISPANGPVTGGTAVQITGTNFFNVTNITIGGIAPTAVTIVSATQITATTPAHAAGAVNVVVMTSSGSGTGINLFTYNIAPPTVTGASPNAGDIAGGTQVTITGTNFTGTTAVTFGGTNALSVNVVSATQITATAPPHAAGLVNVVVTTPAGSGTGTGLFTFTVGAPKVTAVTPSAGPLAGGTVLTITGSDFTGATSVTIGGNPATAVTVVSATQITATTPPGVGFGPVNVVVTSPAGSGTGQGLFIYVGGAPTVTALAPNAGPAAGGTNVTITGTNFVTGATSVMIGGVAATNVAVVSLTQITATTPAHAAGVVNVVATTPVGSGTGTGLFTYAGKATTSLNLTSSPNPSNVGQPVTFTAQVTGNNPTGSVTFTDNGAVIGTAPLVNGVATLTIATLPSGNNSVTASYPGDANNNPDPQTVIQVVNAISDSVKLREMQMAVMPMVTNLSGQAISGAIDSAISNGFGGSCQMFSPNGGGFTYCYDGGSAPTTQGNSLAAIESNMLPDQKQMLEDDFKALGYSDDPAARKAPPMASAREWLVWIDVRGADFNRTTLGSDLKGTQVNGTAGVTRLFTPNFLVGVVGGYEHFDFTSQAYSGKLTGDGYTAGGYVGWRPVSTIRFDASGAWSSIAAADSAGTASGNFTGYRWFAGAGVTGTYAWAATVFEPSARVYMLWEQENAYTDTLGTLQASHNFDTGRGSVGMKVSHDFVTEFGAFVPYVGLYGDYYFSKDDANTATTPGLTTVPLLQGGAARATGGVAVRFGGGAQLEVGGEYSGLGQDTRIWNLKLHGSVPF